jgi:hypothetical protein
MNTYKLLSLGWVSTGPEIDPCVTQNSYVCLLISQLFKEEGAKEKELFIFSPFTNGC